MVGENFDSTFPPDTARPSGFPNGSKKPAFTATRPSPPSASASEPRIARSAMWNEEAGTSNDQL